MDHEDAIDRWVETFGEALDGLQIRTNTLERELFGAAPADASKKPENGVLQYVHELQKGIVASEKAVAAVKMQIGSLSRDVLGHQLNLGKVEASLRAYAAGLVEKARTEIGEEALLTRSEDQDLVTRLTETLCGHTELIADARSRLEEQEELSGSMADYQAEEVGRLGERINTLETQLESSLLAQAESQRQVAALTALVQQLLGGASTAAAAAATAVPLPGDTLIADSAEVKPEL